MRRAPIRSLPSRGSNIRELITFGGLTPTAVDLAWIKFTSLSSVVSGLKLPIYRTDLFGPGFCFEIRHHDSSSDGIFYARANDSGINVFIDDDGMLPSRRRRIPVMRAHVVVTRFNILPNAKVLSIMCARLAREREREKRERERERHTDRQTDGES